MQMSDLLHNATDQDKGRDLHLLAPWSGEPTGMVLTIVGPDSATARKADLAFSDELASLADAMGMVSAESRARARLNSLARKIIRWDVKEGGEPVPFETKAVLILLSVGWVREQVDAFAGDYRNFGPVS